MKAIDTTESSDGIIYTNEGLTVRINYTSSKITMNAIHHAKKTEIMHVAKNALFEALKPYLLTER